MEFMNASKAKSASDLIKSIIKDQLDNIPAEGGRLSINLNSVSQTLPMNGIIYKIMDEVCHELHIAGWKCFYRHYYTFVSRCTIVVSNAYLSEMRNSKYRFFLPCAEEEKWQNDYIAEHPEKNI